MSGLKQNKMWYKCLSHWEFDSFPIFNDFFLIGESKAMKSWVCLKATSRGCNKIKNCLTEHNCNQSRSGIYLLLVQVDPIKLPAFNSISDLRIFKRLTH